MNRRSFVAYLGTMLAIILAGCSELGLKSRATDEEKDREYSIGVFNYATDPQTFDIAIEETPGNSYHDKTVELDAQTADEKISIDGIPSNLSISVGEEYERMFPWPVARAGADEPAVRARIDYDSARDQQLQVFAGIAS